MTYIRPPEAFAQPSSEDETVSINFNNGTQRMYYPPLPDTAPEAERAIAPEYKDTLPDGTFIITFFNGTIVQYYETGFMMKYIKKPEYYYGDVQRQDF